MESGDDANTTRAGRVESLQLPLATKRDCLSHLRHPAKPQTSPVQTAPNNRFWTSLPPSANRGMISTTTRLRPLIIRTPVSFSYSKNVCFQCTTRRLIATSSSKPTSAVPVAAMKASALGLVMTELDKIAPRFEVDADSIRIIRTPSDFYSILKVRRRRYQTIRDSSDDPRIES